ncbi:hypothetical protein GH714_005366 [Hevea brasiliensis]|uniref:PGG domain-containing protein n=1 Tax=Hevea brasiliensis TaxID=3981 RepID=A0A6A6MWP6_HEVBR|nr:hypothetical protein GH714_005294 [Hevea brasiliensis]KAF2318332.1 hypothetical protein GH714_005366 [Hevea brasiliensis]
MGYFVRPRLSTSLQETEVHVYVQFRRLCKAIEEGDLNAVRDFLRQLPHAGREKLTVFGSTALHLATLTGKLNMVELLVENMTKEDLEVRDNNDDTALTIAAGIGATRIAECMIQKNKELVSIQGEQDLLPVIVACKNGHKDTAKYLYAITPSVLLLEKNGAHGSLLLRASIFSKMLGLDQLRRLCSNLLQPSAMLAPPHRLARISGAALQMQRELQWYKEVESIVDPSLKEYTNINNETPGEIFSKKHKELVINGEKWMKETATSCTVVGALIITIMFTAAFTVPGGVLTSRYAEDDFLKSLPTKLIIGLSSLFISIAAMMVAFCATLIIMLKGELKLVIPITLLASIPVTLFMLLQFPLLIEIFVSTYGPSIFDRKMKYWF